jgi:hypothetical protein
MLVGHRVISTGWTQNDVSLVYLPLQSHPFLSRSQVSTLNINPQNQLPEQTNPFCQNLALRSVQIHMADSGTNDPVFES